MDQATCSVEGCERPRRTRVADWCNTHYERWRRTGTIDDPVRPSFDERLWSRIDKSGDCWIWTGSSRGGYGQIHAETANGRRMLRVHRVVWEKLVGPVPPGMFLCHRCDNPPCCNPEHLFVGTPADNSRDMAKKGRAAKPSALLPALLFERLRLTSPKRCPKCGEVKPPEAFGPNAARKDGLQVYCSPCLRAYNRQRRDNAVSQGS